jgi:hypothetical protein
MVIRLEGFRREERRVMVDPMTPLPPQLRATDGMGGPRDGPGGVRFCCNGERLDRDTCT